MAELKYNCETICVCAYKLKGWMQWKFSQGKDKLPKLTQEQSTCLDQLGCQASCSTRQEALEVAPSQWIFICFGCQQQEMPCIELCCARQPSDLGGKSTTTWALALGISAFPWRLPSSQDGESEAAFQGTFRPALSVTHLVETHEVSTNRVKLFLRFRRIARRDKNVFFN